MTTIGRHDGPLPGIADFTKAYGPQAGARRHADFQRIVSLGADIDAIKAMTPAEQTAWLARFAPQGENIWAGTKGYFGPEAMVDAWVREKKYFRPGVFPDNSTTGRSADVGHYTQLVWRATTEVGCAEASSTREDILVCRYAEAGNYRGEKPF